MTSQDLQTIGGRIRLLRRAKGMTQADLARKVFVTQPSVAQWEKNRCTPSAQSMRLIADALDVSRMFLAGTDTQDAA
jgi:transcriptional regulator with XRE-family HTH domain